MQQNIYLLDFQKVGGDAFGFMTLCAKIIKELKALSAQSRALAHAQAQAQAQAAAQAQANAQHAQAQVAAQAAHAHAMAAAGSGAANPPGSVPMGVQMPPHQMAQFQLQQQQQQQQQATIAATNPMDMSRS